jgi:hypothetical protein
METFCNPLVKGHAELTRWHGATRRALHPMMQACVAASRLALPQGGTRSEPLSEVERGCRLGSGSLAGPWLRGSSAVRARARPTLTAPGAGRRATFRDRVLLSELHKPSTRPAAAARPPPLSGTHAQWVYLYHSQSSWAGGAGLCLASLTVVFPRVTRSTRAGCGTRPGLAIVGQALWSTPSVRWLIAERSAAHNAARIPVLHGESHASAQAARKPRTSPDFAPSANANHDRLSSLARVFNSVLRVE